MLNPQEKTNESSSSTSLPLGICCMFIKGKNIKKYTETIITNKSYILEILQMITNTPFVGHELYHKLVIAESF